MPYRITGLAPQNRPSLQADGPWPAPRRLVAERQPGMPCRVTLEDARPGEAVWLAHHVSHDVATPYRSSYAIYIREAAWGQSAACFHNTLPPVFSGRAMSLRAFDAQGWIVTARLSPPGAVEADIEALLGEGRVAYMHAHFAAYGCFAARIDRS